MMRRIRHAAGFTLIETLVALVVAATAAALILTQLRGLVDRAERERAHGLAVTSLLNDAARFASGDATATAQAGNEMVRLIPVGGEAPEVEVFNTSIRNPEEKLPAPTLAYTPFQRYAVRRDRYELSFLAPALALPEGVEAIQGGTEKAAPAAATAQPPVAAPAEPQATPAAAEAATPKTP